VGAHLAGVHGGAVADLGGGEAVEVGELQQAALFAGEGVEDAADLGAQLGEVGGLDRGAELGDHRVVGRGHALDAAALAAAQRHGAHADRPPHAHAEAGRVEHATAAPGLDEDLVHGLLGVVAVADHAQGDAHEQRRIGLTEQGEGLDVAVGGGGHLPGSRGLADA
jgi:hypothetical protein